MARSDNKTPRDGFASENEPGNASKEDSREDFDDLLKKAGDEVLGGSRKERDRRTAAAKEADALFDFAAVLGRDAPDEHLSVWGGHPNAEGCAVAARAYLAQDVLGRVLWKE